MDHYKIWAENEIVDLFDAFFFRTIFLASLDDIRLPDFLNWQSCHSPFDSPLPYYICARKFVLKLKDCRNCLAWWKVTLHYHH